MAPKKKYEATATTRVTRSSSRKASETELGPPNPKKPKKDEKEPKTGEPSEPTKVVEESNDARTEEETKQEEPAASEPDKAVNGFKKTIIIEHCKQCSSFKTRALHVKNGLEKNVEGVNVVVNPEKPRRGCFEVRDEGGEIFVSLLDMKRPFEPMKDLDMDKVVSDIVVKIKC